MRFISIIYLILAFFIYAAFAADGDGNEPQKQYQRYDDLKKKHNQDYRKGLYNDEKKDVVRNWISEDIDFQKRVIKLKSDYRLWAEERLEAGRSVIFKEYEPLNTLTAAEKGILFEYHNRIFGDNSNTRKSTAAGQLKKKETRKAAYTANNINKANELSLDKDAAQVSNKSEPQTDDLRIESRINVYTYIILGFAAILIIAECAYLILKRRK